MFNVNVDTIDAKNYKTTTTLYTVHLSKNINIDVNCDTSADNVSHKPQADCDTTKPHIVKKLYCTLDLSFPFNCWLAIFMNFVVNVIKFIIFMRNNGVC